MSYSYGGAGVSHEEHRRRMSQNLQDGLHRAGINFLLVVYFLEIDHEEFIDMEDKYSGDFWKPIRLINKTYSQEERALCPFSTIRFTGGGPQFELSTAIFHAMEKCHFDGMDHNKLEVVDEKLRLTEYGRKRVEEEIIPNLDQELVEKRKKGAVVFAKAIKQVRAEAEVR